ncbi:MAG TPA: EamA family transporter [Nocardioides sp.]|uniref:EamA family transporter n=1 Tax=Nocardioides sp. TaxID=35761 RepID=UPI002F3EA07A
MPTSTRDPVVPHARPAAHGAATPSALGAVVLAAVFHYLGPSLAVLLFVHVDTLGVAWLRLVSAAVVLALWRRPWTVLRGATGRERLTMLALGAVLAAMNAAFYLALDLAPLATVASIEFLGVVALAAYGVRSRRNLTALTLSCAGVALLTTVSIEGSAAGLAWAGVNCLGFVLYVVLGHRIASVQSEAPTTPSAATGVDRLSVAVVVGAVVATPFGIAQATPAFTHPLWLMWGVGVGVCSTVIPYVADQWAMARLPRASYALMLALLPVTATLCGLVILGQVPGHQEVLGIGLVGAAVALHRPREARS